jgi:hypothetical protein
LTGRGIIVTLPGTEIVNLYRTVGDDLLDPNVRFGLPSSKFNLRIKETAQQSPAFFWYYNNGITIICDHFDGEETGTLNLTNPGIVNGGQSVKQLREAGTISSELLLILRVIESSEKTFSQNIALFTNSQNPISLRDLKSNTDESSGQSTSPPIEMHSRECSEI